MGRIRITVLKTLQLDDLAERYAPGGTPWGACPRHRIGEVFEVKNSAEVPTGFCGAAWADIQRDAQYVEYGPGFWHLIQPRIAISSCTDGRHPVSFKVEWVEE